MNQSDNRLSVCLFYHRGTIPFILFDEEYLKKLYETSLRGDRLSMLNCKNKHLSLRISLILSFYEKDG